jgi:hypothetical protein
MKRRDIEIDIASGNIQVRYISDQGVTANNCSDWEADPLS